MQDTRVTLHTDFRVGRVDPRLFGGFLEHLGRAVYEGVYDPGSAHADEDGFRRDVLEVLRRLQMTGMRYPGGNFVSGYHWLDGVGPREQRPTVRDLAWQSIEPNQVGTDEFVTLCRKMGWLPMLTVNLGTGTPEEARNWVEYCNSPAGTKYASMRAANGSEEPHNVKLWFLGNEMDGSWQLGHVPADQYAVRAQQAAKMMKDTDNSIELVVCGSCSVDLPTYLEWDREVLEYVGSYADYISLHRYVGNPDGDTPDFLAVSSAVDRQIEEMDSVCRFIQSKTRSQKRAYLSFDEWNVWYRTTTSQDQNSRSRFAPHLLEEEYNLEDALVIAGLLNSFIRHADILKIANLAQIVNVIAPVMTRGDDLLVQSIFYPLEMYSRRREGVSLLPVVHGPHYESKTHGLVNYVDTSAILNHDRLNVFLTNRSLDESASVYIDVADQALSSLDSSEIVSGPDANAANSFECPDVIQSRPFAQVRISQGQAAVELPPLSVAAMTFTVASA
ncbi:MAG TPA: alpha-L-arabinofuranosidase C-terminal domain-containing protein [Aggregatilineaceae bacterium]|nr:alpha-L-arabinofuranosidase C-terminal domain-containing protein [Aggregatilineaceae bacterium]